MFMAREMMELIFAVLDVSFNSGHYTVITNNKVDDVYGAVLRLVWHRVSSFHSPDEHNLAPVGCQPRDQANQLGP